MPHASRNKLTFVLLAALLAAGYWLLTRRMESQTRESESGARPTTAREVCMYEEKPYSHGALIRKNEAVMKCDNGTWKAVSPPDK
jgi:hypothetical protein